MKKLNNEIFKVNGKNLIFKLTTDDITGRSKLPSPLNSLGSNMN